MKKLIVILLILVACVSGLFALDSSSFGISVGYGLQSEFVSGNGANTHSIVIGITGLDKFRKDSNFALIADGQFELPVKTGEIKRSDINNLKQWINIGLIFGPAYQLSSRMFKSYVGFGLAVKEQTFKVSSSIYEYSSLVLSFGPGIVLYGAYNVTDSFYISATLSQQYLFLNYARYNAGSLKKVDDSFNLSSTLRLGCGFSFNWNN
ncbi:MAG: hypothetical protein ACSW73_01050 [Spirochaetales bacterium]